VSDPRADRFQALIDPVLASLDAVTATAGGQASNAGQFVAFKLFATYHLGNQIHEVLQTPTSVGLPSTDGILKVVHAREERFALYVLIDGFLFEGASIRDALLQFVNLLFGLGIADDDPNIAALVKQRLSVTSASNTGMEEWIEPSRRPAWLTWLVELRNVTTHRRPLRLPERYVLKLYGPDEGPKHGQVVIECGDGSTEPLEEFIDRTEQDVTHLLRTSLDRLRALLIR
jgi:hypothetical protein